MSNKKFSNCFVCAISASLFFTVTNVNSSSPIDDAKITTSNVGSLKGNFQVTVLLTSELQDLQAYLAGTDEDLDDVDRIPDSKIEQKDFITLESII